MAYPTDALKSAISSASSAATSASTNLAAVGIGNDILSSNFDGLKTLVPALQSALNTLSNSGFYAPVGLVAPFGGASANIPSGWLLCNGVAVSQTTYATLYQVVGPNAFGTDSGGNFYLPNLQGNTVIGAGGSYTLGTAVGASTVGLTSSNLPAHSHTATVSETSTGGQAYASIVNNTSFASGSGIGQRAIVNTSQAGGLSGYEGLNSFGTSPNHTHSVGVSVSGGGNGTSTGTAFSVLQPSLPLNYIIKY